MKRLLTLVALFAVFMGIKAVEMQDFKVDYSQAGTTTLGWRASVIQEDWITADEDGLHLYNPEKTENFWDYQIIIFSGVNLEQEQNYTIKIVAKVSDGTANVRCNLGNWGGGIQSSITVNSTEYQEYIIEGSAVSAENFLIVQFGDYVGTVSFKSVTITHEGREERPVTWMNILTNGDAEGEYGEIACAQSKEYGINDNYPHAAEIEILDGNRVFVTHTQEVNPPIVFDVDTELWGTTYAAGDPKPDNVWQNMFWITLPRPLKAGESYKVSFKYKASENARVSTQTHRMPENYLGGAFGDIYFTTDWQTFESKELTADSSGDLQSIAFLFGEDEQFLKSIDFYFDDIKVMIMDLKEGFFAAGIDTDDADANWNTYNFDNAIEFEWDADLEAYTAVVGTIGDQDSWVNQVMVSTKYGNDKGFKANTIKVTGRVKNDPEEWLCYSAAAKTSINLPAKGVWQVAVDANDKVMNFVKLEGEADKEPVDIYTNPIEIVVRAPERDFKPADGDGNPVEAEIGTGQPWDSQFWIVANRDLKTDEVTVIKFQYKASKAARTTTQVHMMGGDGLPCTYLNWQGIGDVDFTEEWQDFEKEFTVPAGDNGMRSIAFNMAEIKDACNYQIKNIQWYLKDYDLEAEGQTMENLIDTEGTKNFYVKEGAGTMPYEYNAQTPYFSNILYFGDAPEFMKGQNNILSVNLQNNQQIKACQFDLVLPAGVYLSDIYNTWRSDRHSVSYNMLADGTIRVVVVSTDGVPFYDYNGQILNLVFNLDNSLNDGGYVLGMKNIEMTTTDYETLRPEDQYIWVYVKDLLMGDVDNSGQVNVTDVVLIIDQILGNNPWNFNVEAADVNYDTYINVTDVVMVIDHILGNVNLNPNRAAAADAEMGAISLSSDMTTVSLTNPSAYTAFQMDVTLPMGVSLEDVLLTERAAGSHSVVIRKMDDGSYRIIGISMQNKAFEGNAGDLLKLQLSGNAQGAVAINNVLFVTPQGVQHELAGVNAFGDVTGIANVSGNKEVTGNVFDLQGRQMNNAQLKKGLYILNGKKQIVK